MRSPTMAGVEKPRPVLRYVHRSGGPFLGQAVSRPVSFETPVRSGPRHCGQSAARADSAAARRLAATKSKRVFMGPSECSGWRAGGLWVARAEVFLGQATSTSCEYTAGGMACQAGGTCDAVAAPAS